METKKQTNEDKFRLVLSETKPVFEAMRVLNNFHNEVKISINNDGISIIEMDPANIELSILNIDSCAFTDYCITEKAEICINLKQFLDILKSVKKNEYLYIEQKKRDSEYLTLKVVGNSERIIRMPLIEISENYRKIPELEHRVILKIDSKEFSEQMKNLKNSGESIGFKFKENEFNLFNETGMTENIVNINADILYKKDLETAEKCKYSTEYLTKISRAFKISDSVIIKFNEDYPAIFEYKIEDKLKLNLILAPRVGN